MKAKLAVIYYTFLGNYWLIPGIAIIFSIVLAVFFLHLDHAVPAETVKRIPGIYAGSGESAAQLLSSLISALMTVVSIVFSMTLVTITLASTHYGPFVIRSYTNDKSDKITLGVFLGTLIFSIVTLRAIRTGQDEFVPNFAITFAVAMTVISIMVLIVFINHIVTFIHVENILCVLETQLKNVIKKHPLQYSGTPFKFEAKSRLTSSASGFIQAVDVKKAVKVCALHNIRCRVLRRPGEFVIEKEALVEIDGANVEASVNKELLETFIIGSNRTVYQDILFCVEQIVEVALRALSPALNEPFIANLCINYLGQALTCFLKADLKTQYISGMVIMPGITFEALTNACFDQIRLNCANHVFVASHMFFTLANIGPHLRSQTEADIIIRHMEKLKNTMLAQDIPDEDKEQVKSDYQLAFNSIKQVNIENK